MRFVCLDGPPSHRAQAEVLATELLRSKGIKFEWHEVPEPDVETYVSLARGADGLLIYGLRGMLPPEVLDRCPSIRLLVYAGTGAGRAIDIDGAVGRGVRVCNVPDYASDSVADHTLALLLAVSRRIVEGNQIVRGGGWSRNPGIELAGKRLGVVGAGPIGAKVIHRAKAFGMHPVHWTRRPDAHRTKILGAPYLQLGELFRTSDVVSIHLNHNPQTERMISRELLASMPPRSIFVNTARAEVVDNHALHDLLVSGHIWGAGLDVFDPEPPDPADLPQVPNLIVTAHSASVSYETRGVALRVAMQTIVAHAEGSPINVLAG